MPSITTYYKGDMLFESQIGKHTITIDVPPAMGGSDRGPFIQMPSALSYPMSMNAYNWGFETEPEPHLGGRRLDLSLIQT